MTRLLLSLAVLAVVVTVAATAQGKPPASSTYTPPDIAAVLAAGSDAQFYGIQNVSEITLDSIRATAPWNSSTSVSLDQDVELQATDGDPGARGGAITMKAGYGDGSTTAGSVIEVQGGRADVPGKVVIVTGDSAGTAGDCLKSDGAGHAVWAPC